MRRLATIIWHMLSRKQPYQPGDPATWKAAVALRPTGSSAT
ncbi:MAG TPA: hypothetical protein VGX78_01365 [Pirellulales bacterium]|nr:hypothetical protein [Pirellulales bacterium]